MDTITRHIQRPAPYTLLYADDVMLACENNGDLEQLVQTWTNELAKHGLRFNVKKTEYLTTDPDESGTITINGIGLPRTGTFKYVGSVLASDGNRRHEIAARVNAAWLKWRAVTGVLCDKKIKIKHKSAVVRPVAMYGAEA